VTALERMARLDALSDADCRFVLSWLAIEDGAALERGLAALASYQARTAELRNQVLPQPR
jgi:hypothetical protein